VKTRYLLLFIIIFTLVYFVGCGNSNSSTKQKPDWRWSSMNSGTVEKLNAAWSVYIGDIVYAVGENGTILKYDGSIWSKMGSPTNCSLKGVWGANESSVFAVGEFDSVNNKYTLLKYNGSQWAAMNHIPQPGLTNSFYGIWGQSNTMIAVGDKISGKSDGVNWVFQSEALDLRGIWGSSFTGKVYAGGADWVSPGETVNNNIFEFTDGTPWTWTNKSGTSLIRGVWVYHNDIFAVGANGLILHSGDHTLGWEQIETGTTENLNAVNGDMIDGEVQAFIVGDHGTVLHFNGNVIRKLQSGTTENLYGITYSSVHLYAVGAHGVILKAEWKN
jgi:hypothetical protein